MRDLLGARTPWRLRIHLIVHVFHVTGWNIDRTEGKCIRVCTLITAMTYLRQEKPSPSWFFGPVEPSRTKPKKLADLGMGSLWCIKLPMTCFMIGTPLATLQNANARKFYEWIPQNSQIGISARDFFQTIMFKYLRSMDRMSILGEPFSNYSPTKGSKSSCVRVGQCILRPDATPRR